ncbi:hypothetical protein ACP3TY_19715 [Pseudomonas rustica]|uniref:hypothetical protein n=1 Tax=Pseudomonas rustica TaxID=2827099 RepID=UPI003CF98FC8
MAKRKQASRNDRFVYDHAARDCRAISQSLREQKLCIRKGSAAVIPVFNSFRARDGQLVCRASSEARSRDACARSSQGRSVGIKPSLQELLCGGFSTIKLRLNVFGILEFRPKVLHCQFDADHAHDYQAYFLVLGLGADLLSGFGAFLFSGSAAAFES